MSDLSKAFALIEEGFEALKSALKSTDETEESVERKFRPKTKKGKSKKAKKDKDKKGKGKKKSKKSGPTIDDVRAACLEMVELVDEHGDEDDDGNEVLLELISEVDEDATCLGDLEDSDDNMKAILEAAKEYIEENFDLDDD